MEPNAKEKEIITQLITGRKTWTELTRNVKMSRETLYLKLKKLMNDGTIVKYGKVEFGRIVDFYDIKKRKDPTIVSKVQSIFEKEDYFIFPTQIIEDLSIEQSLVQWLHHSLRVLMHFTRKILDVRFAKDLSPKQRIEYTNIWKRDAISYASKWMNDFVEETVQYSDESWIKIFGLYEENPKALLQAMVNFSERIDEAERNRRK